MSGLRKLWYIQKSRKNVWLKLEELRKLQNKRLRALVKHAYENVQFYHKRFKLAKIKASDIKSVEDLKKIPVLTRKEVRDNFPGPIVARGVQVEKCKKFRTSGSTGMPLTVVLDKKAEDHRAASFFRPFLENGVSFRDRFVMVGDPRTFPKRKKWYQSLGFNDRLYIPATEDVERRMSSMARFKPNAIFGYSSWIYLLARSIEKSGNKIIAPKRVFGTAVVLTTQYRSLINSVFHTEMLDLYGTVEFERVAWECNEHAGYHMDIDNIAIEIIKDGEPASSGEQGRIVLTCLYNYAMPLIRYDIGDLGVPSDEKCPCGRGLPLMKNLIGRADDLVFSPSGRMIVPENFANVMRVIPGVGQYQVLQEGIDKMTVRLVKGIDFSEITIQQVKDGIRKLVGELTKVEIKIVDEIPRDSSGKIRAVISNVHATN